MNIALSERTEETVRIFHEKTRRESVRKNLPQEVQTVEEALEAYRQKQLTGQQSYGRTIVVDGDYIGDVWCYSMNGQKSPGALIGVCIFQEESWSKGIATQAVMMFLNEVRKKYGISSFGAFVFADHPACIRVLEKNGFRFKEEFSEEERPVRYYQKRF